MTQAQLYIGLMSGTSLDGIDGVLVRFQGSRIEVIQHLDIAYPDALRKRFRALNKAAENEIENLHIAAHIRTDLAIKLIKSLQQHADGPIIAIADHGQTVRHCPNSNPPYTLQIHQGARLAELTGIDCVVDFRSRDIAAGGQGAPLVPAFHQAFLSAEKGYRAIVNIGGIANLSLLKPGTTSTATGFDTGPGNTLLDTWCQRHRGQSYDHSGQWAASGHPDARLLEILLADPYFTQAAPKSTGREKFNLGWLDKCLSDYPDSTPSAADVQATLLTFSVETIYQGLRQACHKQGISDPGQLEAVYICGGGALNTELMKQLTDILPTSVLSTDTLGIPPMQMEATAFAWLGKQAIQHQKVDLTATTGARHPGILGAIYRT